MLRVRLEAGPPGGGSDGKARGAGGLGEGCDSENRGEGTGGGYLDGASRDSATGYEEQEQRSQGCF